MYGYKSPTGRNLPRDLPNIVQPVFAIPDQRLLERARPPSHPPRLLMLYGLLRGRSYSRFLTLEAARLL